MALNPIYSFECVCNQKPCASRDVRRASREMLDTFRETDSESAVHLLRLLNSNLPFSNPRRARSIHALAVPATTITLVSQIFRHLVTLHGPAHLPFLSHRKDRSEIIASFGIPRTRITIIFFSLGNPSSPYYSIFYTGHFDTGQETLTIFFFFFLSLSR